MNETGGSYGTQPWPSDWWHVTGANWAFSTGWSASLWLESHFNMFDLWRLSAQIIDQFPWKKCGDRDDRDEGGFSRMFGGKFKDLGQFLISRSFRWRSQAVISVPGKTRWGKNMSIEEIRSRLVRHLQSMGGHHGPNMGPAIFMAVWTSGIQQCRDAGLYAVHGKAGNYVQQKILGIGTLWEYYKAQHNIWCRNLEKMELFPSSSQYAETPYEK